MKKSILIAIIACISVTACKKGTIEKSKTLTTVYLQAEAVDNDDIVTTQSPIALPVVRQ